MDTNSDEVKEEDDQELIIIPYSQLTTLTEPATWACAYYQESSAITQEQTIFQQKIYLIYIYDASYFHLKYTNGQIYV